MSCQDDANLVGPISLFLGVETWNWNTKQFLDEGNLAKAHGISTLFIKVAEVGSPAGGAAGWWYGGLDAFDKNIYQPLKAAGVTVIPYIFPYGYDVQTEIGIAKDLLAKYGEVCLDMEGDRWTGQTGADNARLISDALAPLPGKVWLSHPANFATSNQTGFMEAIRPLVNVFMPMAYNNYLESVTLDQLHALNPQACIQPTLDLSQEFGTNDILANAQALIRGGSPALSLWYEGFANIELGLVDQLVALFKGTQPVPPPIIPLTSKGEVATFVDVSQMEPNESEFECGYFAAGEVHCAAPVGRPANCDPEELDNWADIKAGGINTGGVSIQDMHWLFALPGPDGQGRHFWDIDSIAPGSAQSHDIAEIKAALQYGYPVVVTVVEATVYDMDLGGNPYAPNWKPSGNHVLVATGIAGDGNLLYHDTAAINGGIFGKIAPQPRRYAAQSINHTWASIVQLPWLPPIQSGDPLSWQGGSMPVPTGWKDDGTTLTAPNGIQVKFGFRSRILNDHAWDSIDVPLEAEAEHNPLEESNPALGAGSRQTTRKHILEYTRAMGVFDGFAGQELFFIRADRDAKAKALAAAAQQIVALQSQIAQLEAGGSGAPANLSDIKSKLDQLAADTSAAAQKLASELAAAESELAGDIPPAPKS